MAHTEHTSADMLTLDQVEQQYGVARATLYRYIQDGRLQLYRRGMDRRRYVRRADIEAVQRFQPLRPTTTLTEAAVDRALAFQRETFGDRVLSGSSAESIDEARRAQVDW